jgi:hypothetical protein
MATSFSGGGSGVSTENQGQGPGKLYHLRWKNIIINNIVSQGLG